MKTLKFIAKYFGINEGDIGISEHQLPAKGTLSAFEKKCVDQLESLLTNRLGQKVNIIPVEKDDSFNVIIDGYFFIVCTVYV